MLGLITRRLLPVAAAFLGAAALAATPVGIPAVDTALAHAKVPADALVAVVQEVDARHPRLSWQADRPFNPASLMKLVTTEAALDLLGPAWTWSTPVWLNGAIVDGVLEGDLVIKGTGDPKLVVERLWVLLQRVRQRGVREIRGDIVLDRSAFVVPEQNPADFDGEPLRPYNVRPDALLLNFRAQQVTLEPDPAQSRARTTVEPTLDGVRVDAGVPLNGDACEDWRVGLKPDFSDATHLHLGGSYPLACGARTWSVAYPEPKRYDARLLVALWQAMGGRLQGGVRDGPAPATEPSFEMLSPTLPEVIRDINKFSNNVMAEQLFLTLGLHESGLGSPDTARIALRQWLRDRFGNTAVGAVVDNGSGLSRESRVSARLLAALLQSAWASPVMPELMSSLPLAGLDGTLRRSRMTLGRAHLKTGSLRDVAGIAGYVLGTSGRRYIVAAIVNHPNANAARPALDALVEWVADDEQASSARR
jgi:D-alanyl-D-alanine carboxypeptidase/D-alanyl-D-alanine-endopeptidase (penicillin-binding protein 4)